MTAATPQSSSKKLATPVAPQESSTPMLVAAVDLGSNSFHMIMARDVAGELRVVNRQREPVRLAAGLTADGQLDEDAQRRALACLERFGEQIRLLPAGHVRAVGTNTLRMARDARAFLDRAETVLGHPIDIVSPQEESRLVYNGVCHSTPPSTGRRLVIDIGGGSTECILGDGFELITAESVFMGCVSFSLRYFPGGNVTRESFRRAELAARRELLGIEATFRPEAGMECLGSAGTFHAVQRILVASGWTSAGITLDGLRRLEKALIGAENAEKLDLPELRPDRKAVLPGGLAILIALVDSFGIERITAAPGGLREGLLYDLYGRFHEEDVRDRTIRNILARFHVDAAQGRRVGATAVGLLEQVTESWSLSDAHCREYLSWAGQLHELGLAIAHTGYHKHGEYLLANAEMAGFTVEDQLVLATLVRHHRRKLLTASFEKLAHLKPKVGVRLAILLRLAVLLHRTRDERPLPRVALRAEKNAIELRFPSKWLEEHALFQTDITAEAETLAALGYELKAS